MIMKEDEEWLRDHREKYPERMEEQARRFTSIDDRLRDQDVQLGEIKSILKAVQHNEPSAKTMLMFEKLTEQTNVLVSQNVRINRVLFGDVEDPEDIGIVKMVREIHGRAVGNDGFWKQFFFVAKVAGAVTAISFLATGIILFIKKF